MSDRVNLRLRKDIPPLPSPTKHEYRVVLPKGRCPLLRMMRSVIYSVSTSYHPYLKGTKTSQTIACG